MISTQKCCVKANKYVIDNDSDTTKDFYSLYHFFFIHLCHIHVLWYYV